jgi:uncharacterized protein YuzE
MLVSYDPEAGATYVEFTDDQVARTVSLSDLVMVDVDLHGDVVGVEFVVAPRDITDAMFALVADAYPAAFKDLAADRSWLLTHAA